MNEDVYLKAYLFSPLFTKFEHVFACRVAT